jgi:hypothetical protein
MIRHVLLFKFRPSASKQQRRQAFNMLKDLGSDIPQVREWSIGVQALQSEKAYDIAQVSSFDNFNALEEFKLNPAHIKVRDYLSKIADWVSVDYEFNQ